MREREAATRGGWTKRLAPTFGRGCNVNMVRLPFGRPKPYLAQMCFKHIGPSQDREE